MPIDEADLAERGTLPEGSWTEIDDVPFGQVLYNVAESIVRSQAQLDAEAAETMQTLANTEVEIVPEITREVDDDGSVNVSSEEPVSRSLLALGFTPTRYQFSETTIEVEFDTKLSRESKTASGSGDDGGPADGAARRGSGLRASTSNNDFHRKLNRDVKSNTKVTAKIEPAPQPTGLSPSDSVRRSSDGDTGSSDSGGPSPDAGSDGGGSESPGGDGSSGDAGPSGGE